MQTDKRFIFNVNFFHDIGGHGSIPFSFKMLNCCDLYTEMVSFLSSPLLESQIVIVD